MINFRLCKPNYRFLHLNITEKFWLTLSHPSTGSECYWTLLKTLLNGRKIPCIPFLFNGKREKSKRKNKIFNSFLQKQCSLIDFGIILPWQSPLITKKSLCDVYFLIEDIENSIIKIDSNKAHGDDIIIIIHMLEFCDKSIGKPLNIIVKYCLRLDIFQSERKI